MRQAAAFSHPSDRTSEASWMDLTEPTGPRRGSEVRALTAPDGAADTSQSPREAVSLVRGRGGVGGAEGRGQQPCGESQRLRW